MSRFARRLHPRSAFTQMANLAGGLVFFSQLTQKDRDAGSYTGTRPICLNLSNSLAGDINYIAVMSVIWWVLKMKRNAEACLLPSVRIEQKAHSLLFLIQKQIMLETGVKLTLVKVMNKVIMDFLDNNQDIYKLEEKEWIPKI